MVKAQGWVNFIGDDQNLIKIKFNNDLVAQTV